MRGREEEEKEGQGMTILALEAAEVY